MPRQLQIETMDDDLRNSLWNVIYARFEGHGGHWTEAARLLAHYLFKLPVDSVPTDNARARAWIRDRFFEAFWHESYDILEFLVHNVDVIKKPDDFNAARYYSDQFGSFLSEVNVTLERELAGYRFIRGTLAPITDPVEVTAIEGAANIVAAGTLTGPSIHIRAALDLLGRKPTPDYRNSIKESISAVEAAVNLTAGTDVGGVAKAIEVLAAKVEIHPSLRAALKQLYGYSSDADGIRHAILEQTNIGYSEAKFMLVACSAFVSFIGDKGRESSR